MNMEQLQKCFTNSQTLNQMKADITLFVCMFVTPFEKVATKKFGKFELLKTIQSSGGNFYVEIATHKTGFSLTGTYGKEQSLFGIYTGEEIPVRCVKSLWQMLPEILDEMLKLCPEIRPTLDFYSNVAD